MTRDLFFARATTINMTEHLYRRKLPHWSQDRVTYLVSWRLAEGPDELDASERDLVVVAMREV